MHKAAWLAPLLLVIALASCIPNPTLDSQNPAPISTPSSNRPQPSTQSRQPQPPSPSVSKPAGDQSSSPAADQAPGHSAQAPEAPAASASNTPTGQRQGSNDSTVQAPAAQNPVNPAQQAPAIQESAAPAQDVPADDGHVNGNRAPAPQAPSDDPQPPGGQTPAPQAPSDDPQPPGGQTPAPQASSDSPQPPGGQTFAPAAPLTKSCLASQPAGFSVQVKDADFGAVGDGQTDDTQAIQRAIDKVAGSGGGTVYIPSGTYLINPIAHRTVQGLVMKNNVTLRLADDAVLKAIPTWATHYSLISFIDVQNANLIGGTLIGERNEHTGRGGEWGHGVNIQSGHDVVIENVVSRDFWGDGFYIGQSWENRDTHSIRVWLCNVTADNNRRQGLSIVDGQNIHVLNSTFTNTNGISPQAGVDIEPEAGNLVDDVEIRDSKIAGNSGDGIVLTTGQGKDKISHVRIENNQVLNNRNGIMVHRAVNCQVRNNTIRNAGNNTNMAYPMTLHLFAETSGIKVEGNTHIGGKTVNAGQDNEFSDARTSAGAYIRGTLAVGQTLYAELLDTDGVPSDVSYQWYANGVAIAGATSASYQLTDADAGKEITVTAVFADRAGNGEEATSASSARVVR